MPLVEHTADPAEEGGDLVELVLAFHRSVLVDRGQIDRERLALEIGGDLVDMLGKKRGMIFGVSNCDCDL